jgi:hypothetical protein
MSARILTRHGFHQYQCFRLSQIKWVSFDENVHSDRKPWSSHGNWSRREANRVVTNSDANKKTKYMCIMMDGDSWFWWHGQLHRLNSRIWIAPGAEPRDVGKQPISTAKLWLRFMDWIALYVHRFLERRMSSTLRASLKMLPVTENVLLPSRQQDRKRKSLCFRWAIDTFTAREKVTSLPRARGIQQGYHHIWHRLASLTSNTFDWNWFRVSKIVIDLIQSICEVIRWNVLE